MIRASEYRLRDVNTKLTNFLQRAANGSHVQLWFVGGSWGQHSLVHDFIAEGTWILGWNRSQQPAMVEAADHMLVGDLIVLKKNAGPQIEVLCIGVVTSVLGEVGKKWQDAQGKWAYSEDKTFMCNVHWFDTVPFKMHSYGMYSALTRWEFNTDNPTIADKIEATDILRQLRLM